MTHSILLLPHTLGEDIGVVSPEFDLFGLVQRPRDFLHDRTAFRHM